MTGGAYLLCLSLQETVEVTAGRLGRIRLPAGRYAYVGSARGGIETRIRRHRRQCEERRAVRRWHIDAVLAHEACRWEGAQHFPGGDECALTQALAAHPFVAVPVAGFGASDCVQGCPAHFLSLPDDIPIPDGNNSVYSNINKF